MDEKSLQSFLRTVIKTGKYVMGTKEVTKSIKGSSVVIAASTPQQYLEQIHRVCTSADVSLIIYPGSSVELGRICGKPFRISSIVVKSLGEASLEELTNQS